MPLSEPSLNVSDEVCSLDHPPLTGRLSFRRFARILTHGLGLHEIRKVAVVVYGQRFKEMRRDQDSITYRQQMSYAYSQLARQSPR